MPMESPTSRAGSVGRCPPVFLAGCLAAIGCAHHRADQYAYAPPYAPPVYPQPPVPTMAQPVAAVAGGAPAGAVPVTGMAGLPAGTVVAAGQPMAPGMVVPAAGGECPPCSEQGASQGFTQGAIQGSEGVVVAGSVTMIDGAGQTPPCPPGP